MSRIEWGEELSVGVDKIDRQHMFLIATYNRLHEMLETEEVPATTQTIVRSMQWYTKQHFEEEEALMTEVGFPDVDLHRREHKRIMASVRTLFHQYEVGESPNPIQVLNLLRQWLVNHINTFDRRLAKFVDGEAGRAQIRLSNQATRSQ